MNSETIVRCVLGIVIAGFSIVPAYFFLEFTPLYLGWCIIWACCFAILSASNNLVIRGLFFMCSTVAVALIGVAYAKAINTEFVWAIEYVGQLMVLIGGGVGANFISAQYLQKHRA
jgi:hypothetical protein